MRCDEQGGSEPQEWDRPPTGLVETADDAGATTYMEFWLPPGVRAAELGLVRAIFDDDQDQS
jgi:hypothetical protein